MKKHLLTATILLTFSAIFIACKKEVLVEPFDRQEMLENWADNMIIPAQKAYNTTTKTLHTQAQAFVNTPTPSNLEALRTAWLESYLAWQHVPYFIPQNKDPRLLQYDELEPISMLYHGTNVYPTDTLQIRHFINSEEYNLSARDKYVQGFPALEFMLYGLANTDSGILAYYKESTLDAEKHKQYLLFLTKRLQSISDTAFDKWTNGYRDSFVMGIEQEARDCAKKIISDYVNSFTNELLLKKVGAPIGHSALVCGDCYYIPPNRFLAEGPLSRIHSKTLLLEALDAAQDFYNGVPFGRSCEGSKSIYQHLYLLNTHTIRTDEKLCDVINKKFNLARAGIEGLADDLGSEAENNTKQMYDVFLLLLDSQMTFHWSMREALGLYDRENLTGIKRFHCQ